MYSQTIRIKYCSNHAEPTNSKPPQNLYAANKFIFIILSYYRIIDVSLMFANVLLKWDHTQ